MRASGTTIVGLVLMATALNAAAAPKPAVKPAGVATPAPAAVRAPTLPPLTAEQIVERNVTARGGLTVWKAVQTMSWKGKMGAGGATYITVSAKGKLRQKEREEMQLPYRLEFKRPLKSRLELDFNGQTAVQVYDGVKGWKRRPYLGRDEWEAYSADELQQAAAEPGIDGYLIDHAGKGAKVELTGTDKVEGHAAYKLKVTRKDGQVRQVWVDGQSFLELKVDGAPRRLDGKLHAVAVYLRDYKRDQGLMVPHLQETVVQSVPKTEKVTIESVTLNPPLDDARFANAK